MALNITQMTDQDIQSTVNVSMSAMRLPSAELCCSSSDGENDHWNDKNHRQNDVSLMNLFHNMNVLFWQGMTLCNTAISSTIHHQIQILNERTTIGYWGRHVSHRIRDGILRYATVFFVIVGTFLISLKLAGIFLLALYTCLLVLYTSWHIIWCIAYYILVILRFFVSWYALIAIYIGCILWKYPFIWRHPIITWEIFWRNPGECSRVIFNEVKSILRIK